MAIPKISFFLSKVVDLNKLIAGLEAYRQIYSEEIGKVEIYKDPMLWVEMVDYSDAIENFLNILTDERRRIAPAESESGSLAGHNDASAADGQIHE